MPPYSRIQASTLYIQLINLRFFHSMQVYYSPVWLNVNTLNSDESLGVRNVVTTIEREVVLAH